LIVIDKKLKTPLSGGKMIQGYKLDNKIGSYEVNDLIIIDTEKKPKDGGDVLAVTESGLILCQYHKGGLLFHRGGFLTSYATGKKIKGAVFGAITQTWRYPEKDNIRGYLVKDKSGSRKAVKHE
jgi:hypothetical protein